MILNEQQARAVWEILVEECGVSAIDSGVEQFIDTAARKCKPHLEYRFFGNLGFGGKVYLDTPPRVSCYPEDENTARKRAIEKANKRLEELFHLWMSEALVIERN